LTVSGSGASHGVVKVLGSRLTGALGRQKIATSF
jgi:hypothetical protein